MSDRTSQMSDTEFEAEVCRRAKCVLSLRGSKETKLNVTSVRRYRGERNEAAIVELAREVASDTQYWAN